MTMITIDFKLSISFLIAMGNNNDINNNDNWDPVKPL